MPLGPSWPCWRGAFVAAQDQLEHFQPGPVELLKRGLRFDPFIPGQGRIVEHVHQSQRTRSAWVVVVSCYRLGFGFEGA